MKEFKEHPVRHLVDARGLAEQNGIVLEVAKIAGETADGHCSRAKNPMALWHLDIYAPIVYESTDKYLNLRGQERVDSPC